MKKITQSFLKDYTAYLRGDECGNLIHYKYVEDKLIPPTKAQKLGIYFEYIFGGALPKDKQVPHAEILKSGKEMTKPYRDAYDNAKKLRKMIEDKGFKIISVGQKFDKGRFSGTVDAVLEATKKIVFDDGFTLKKGDRIVIDLKYAGTLGDRWNEMGWNLPDLTDDQKAHHGTQAKQYHYISGMPFFFMVHSSKNSRDGDRNPENEEGSTDSWPIELFRVSIAEDSVKQHIVKANHLHEKFEIERETGGFEARPSYSKCVKCAIANLCKDKHVFPEPHLVEL